MAAISESDENWVKGSSILGRWVVVGGPIRGGYGTVIRAHDGRIKTDVAIKIPDPAVNRHVYEREARLMLGIHPHQNVAMVLGVERLEGRPIILMYYYPEGSLRRWIGSPWLLTQTELVLRLALQVCDGMLHVQQCGVAVHRDIKPDNLLILSREAVAIGDFGLALASERASPGGGTLEYAAPEGAGTEQSDIYSLGATLHEMLTGHPPFGRRQQVPPEELRRRHHEDLPKRDPRIPMLVWEVVQDCLEKNPLSRPRTFKALRERLGKAYAELAGMDPPEPMNDLGVSAEYWIIHGQGLHSLNRHEEETACYHTAIELDPTSAEAHRELANNLRELGRQAEAVQAARQAISMAASSSDALDAYGSILHEMGDAAGAECQFRQSLKADPKNATAWYNLAILLDDQGRVVEAIRCYEESLSLDPYRAEGWTNLGIIYQRQHESQRAEECFRTALAKEPCLSEATMALGRLLKRQGRHREAVELFDWVMKQCG
jgi:serine/threonine protein kinase